MSVADNVISVAKNTNRNAHNDGPQYPAQGGAKTSGDHSLNMAMQGVQRVSATCDLVLDVAQGIPGRSAPCNNVLPASNPPILVVGSLPLERKGRESGQAPSRGRLQLPLTLTVALLNILCLHTWRRS